MSEIPQPEFDPKLKLHQIPTIPGYRVNRVGVVIGPKGKPVRHCRDSDGRIVINVSNAKYRGTVSLVRIMGEVFSKDYRADLLARHKDGDKSNVSLTNIEWVARNLVSRPPYTKNPRPNTVDKRL